MKVKFIMPQNSGLRADFNIDEYHTIATKAELNAEIGARIEGDSTLQSEIARVENEIPDTSGLATKTELQAIKDEIPTKASDIGALPDTTKIPTKTSDLTNDNNFATVSQIPTNNNQLVNGAGYITNADLPTKTSELINDSGFITKFVSDLSNYYLKSETYTKQEVNSLIADIPKFTVTVVEELPLIGQPMVLYLVPKNGEAPDVHNEYIWITSTSSYELIGTTAIDLDGYATEQWVTNQNYVNSTTLTNTLTNYVLSASLSSVATSGDYNDLTNKPVIPVYTAGEGIDITNNVISNTQTSAVWGNITGTLSNQTDLQNALDLKADDSNVVHKTGSETITGFKTFTNKTKITTTTAGAILELESSAGNTNFLLKRTGGSTCVLESGDNVGLFGTQSNHSLQIRTNYTNRMTFTTSGDVILTKAPSSDSNSNQLATTAWTISKIPTESTVSNWGFTKNVGTVTSVNNVQPVNGNVTLSIPDTSNFANKDLSNLSSTGNAKFQVPLVSGTNIKTINNNSILGSGNLTLDALPSQAGYTDATLTTNGTDASWRELTQLPLSQVHCVIDTYSSGTSWYRVYDDGWCEQGGQAQSFTDTTVNFLKTFANTNYNVVIGAYDVHSPDDNAFCTVQWRDKTVNSVRFQAGYNAVSYSTTVDWQASGYLSEGA